MAISTRSFDPAAYLDTPEAVGAYLTEALETGDSAFIRDALGVIARAGGMTKVAKDADLSRESLYRSLGSDGNPEFATVIRVINALGLKLTAKPAKARRRAPRPRRPRNATAA